MLCLKSIFASDELTMEPCCALKYYPAVDACQSEKVPLVADFLLPNILINLFLILFYIFIRMETQKQSVGL